MDESILADFEQAITVAFGGGMGGADAAQATNYCQQVKELPEGWKYAMQLFMGESTSVEVKFYSLGVVQDSFVSGRYAAMPGEDQVQMRAVFMEWVTENGLSLGGAPSFIRNKVALVITLLLKHQYPEVRVRLEEGGCERCRVSPPRVTALWLRVAACVALVRRWCGVRAS